MRCSRDSPVDAWCEAPEKRMPDTASAPGCDAAIVTTSGENPVPKPSTLMA